MYSSLTPEYWIKVQLWSKRNVCVLKLDNCLVKDLQFVLHQQGALLTVLVDVLVVTVVVITSPCWCCSGLCWCNCDNFNLSSNGRSAKGLRPAPAYWYDPQHHLTFDLYTSNCCISGILTVGVPVCVGVSSDHPPVSGSHHHAQLQPVQTKLVLRWLQADRRSVSQLIGWTRLISLRGFDQFQHLRVNIVFLQFCPETSWLTPPPCSLWWMMLTDGRIQKSGRLDLQTDQNQHKSQKTEPRRRANQLPPLPPGRQNHRHSTRWQQQQAPKEVTMQPRPAVPTRCRWLMVMRQTCSATTVCSPPTGFSSDWWRFYHLST